MTNLYLDLETIPTQDALLHDYIAKAVKAPSNYKDEEKIAAYIAEGREEAIQKSAFDGCFNHIVCIGYAFDDEKAESFYAATVKDEAKIIADFYNVLSGRNKYLSGFTFIGHNIQGFDLRVLRHRSTILGIKPPQTIPFESKPWDKNPYDTMQQWDGKSFPKLEKLALVFGLEPKTMSGGDVYELWKNQQEKVIREYCEADVELTRCI